MNGQGTLTFENGDVYEGQFRNGIFNGNGTYKSVSGWVYTGQFRNGYADGKGKLTTEGQATYEGTFKRGSIKMKIKWLSLIRVIGLVLSYSITSLSKIFREDSLGWTSFSPYLVI